METSSRQRLIAASQAVELEHLQSLIRNRDVQSQRTEENLLALLAESRGENNRLVREVSDLKRCVDELNKQLTQVRGGSSDTTTIHDLRKRISMLEEEREVMLEKIISHRNLRVPTLCDAFSQTSEVGLTVKLATIDEIRSALLLEHSLKNDAEATVAVHASNIRSLQLTLQTRIEAEVQRLQSQQEAFTHILQELRPQEPPIASVPKFERTIMQQQESEMNNLRKRLNDLHFKGHEDVDQRVSGTLRHSSILQRMLQNASGGS